MFYRRKYYVVKNEFIEIFNDHFNDTNLPNQIKYGSRLIGRWMKDNNDGTTEVFAIWEYDSYLNSIKKLNQKLEATRYMLKEYMIGMKNMAGKNMFYRSTY